MSEIKFALDYSKRLSKCKRCKKELAKGSVRLAKLVPDFFGGGDEDMKQFYHIDCLFDSFKRARATTKIIESTDEIQNFTTASKEHQQQIKELIEKQQKEKKSPIKSSKTARAINLDDSESESNSESEEEDKKIIQKKRQENDEEQSKKALKKNESETETEEESSGETDDDKFETFQEICDRIASDSSHLKKTAVLKDFFKHGINGKGYKGDKYIFLKLIMPSVSNRVYNLNSIQITKLFSRIFDTDLDEMNDHLNQGDVAETCRYYFGKSESNVKPQKESKLTLKQVDAFLDKLTEITKENDQAKLLEQIARRCTKNDLRTFIRLVKKDLRIDAGTKSIMDSLGPNAYQAFQVSRDLKDVVTRVDKLMKEGKPGLKKDLSVRVNLMTAVKPMLAEACKSAEKAFQKCPNGVFAEIKYDGERLQVHKNGSSFSYYSRNLKAVQPHKVEHLKEFIPKAFGEAKSLILDGEVLLYDNKTKKPLPFGTLGSHKKGGFKDASVCYYVFDILYANGKDLMNTPMNERREYLEQNMKEIPGRIMLSEQKKMKNPAQLKELMMDAINEGLEGLVMKDVKGIYEPGKRHWLKMKKDYLEDGSMADTADLVVLGAYYGTGNKGGLKSVFLMGTYDPKTSKWYTVTKVGNGFDDAKLNKLQTKIDMVEIKKKPELVPDWLVVHKSLTPDFVVKNPKHSPVWELTGAEFSKSDTHTADGISIRFPRVTKFRDDKSWKEATDLPRLKVLFKTSKEKTDIAPDKGKSSKRKSKEVSEDESDASVESPKKSFKPKKNTDVKSNTTMNKTSKDQELPSIFEGKSFYLAENVSKQAELKRYIMAYDGDLTSDISEATCVIVEDPNDKPTKAISDSAKIVSQDQLWHCIKTKKLNF